MARVDGRRLRSERTKQLIIEAYLALLREGSPSIPTATQIADRAGYSVRSVFEKFPDLLALRDRIESALVRMGLPPEGRRFLPHVTLCRLRDASVARVSRFLAANNLFRVGPIPVEHFTLFSSAAQGQGRIYVPEVD